MNNKLKMPYDYRKSSLKSYKKGMLEEIGKKGIEDMIQDLQPVVQPVLQPRTENPITKFVKEFRTSFEELAKDDEKRTFEIKRICGNCKHWQDVNIAQCGFCNLAIDMSSKMFSKNGVRTHIDFGCNQFIIKTET